LKASDQPIELNIARVEGHGENAPSTEQNGKDGVIEQYAIGGAVAAIFYIEPINTNDLDVFFHVKDSRAGLDILAPLYEYLSGLGYIGQGEAVDIEGWPVQFLPIFNPLLEEAVEKANEVRFQRTKTRVMQAEHLVAIMLQTGR